MRACGCGSDCVARLRPGPPYTGLPCRSGAANSFGPSPLPVDFEGAIGLYVSLVSPPTSGQGPLAAASGTPSAAPLCWIRKLILASWRQQTPEPPTACAQQVRHCSSGGFGTRTPSEGAHAAFA
jgi:hypothetical protein